MRKKCALTVLLFKTNCKSVLLKKYTIIVVNFSFKFNIFIELFEKCNELLRINIYIYIILTLLKLNVREKKTKLKVL